MGLDIYQRESTEALSLDPMRSVEYAPSGDRHLKRVLQSLQIRSSDAILDLGCGKGGALITMAKFPFRKLGGVEISPKLYGIVQNNLARLHITNVALFCCDAANFLNFSDYNYLYFFNPFPCRVMEEVLNNVTRDLLASPRKMTIIYMNPVCHEIIVKDGLFAQRASFPVHFELPFPFFSLYTNEHSLCSSRNPTGS